MKNNWQTLRKYFNLFLLLALVTLIYGCCNMSTRPKNETAPLKLVCEKISFPPDFPNPTALEYFDGSLWVGTEQGLYRYKDGSWNQETKENRFFDSDYVVAMDVNARTLWISMDDGALSYDGNKYQRYFSSGKARSSIGVENTAAVATAYGLVVTSVAGGGTERVHTSSAGLAYNEVNSVSMTSDGSFLAGTKAGVSLVKGSSIYTFKGPGLQPSGYSLIKVPASPPNCQLMSNNIKCSVPYLGKNAIGTTLGLTITDFQNYENYYGDYEEFAMENMQLVKVPMKGNSPIPGNSVTALATPPNGDVLFVGTNCGLGILKADKTWQDTNIIPAYSPYAPVKDLTCNDDALWVLTGGSYRRW